MARGASREDADLEYTSAVLDAEVLDGQSTLVAPVETTPPSRESLAELLTTELARRRNDELDRGITLVGPHRDDVHFTLGGAGVVDCR